MATLTETPRSFLVGRLSPHQVTAVRSRLAQWESSKRGSRAGSERRQDLRVATDEPARMKVLQPPGPGAEIRVLDVSRSGFKIALPEFLAPGTIIQIHMKAVIAFAEVRHCARSGDEFQAGVCFQDVFWTGSAK